MGVKYKNHICWVWSMGCNAVFKFIWQNKEECWNIDNLLLDHVGLPHDLVLTVHLVNLDG